MRMRFHIPRGALRHSFWPLLIAVLAALAIAAAIFCSLIFSIGLLLAALLALYLRTILSARNRMEHLISERTAELRQSREMLRLVLDSIPVGVHWKNCDSVYMGCNCRVAQDGGIDSPEQIVGKTDFDLPWKARAEFYRSRDRRVIQSGQPLLGYEQSATIADGRVLLLYQNKVPLRDSSGRIIGVLSAYQDITERKRAEEALLESEARYRAVVEHSPEGIAVSIDDIIVYVNPAAVRLAHAKGAEELLGRSVLDFIHEDFRAQAMRRRAAMQQTGLPTTAMEGKLRRLDGTIMEGEWMAVPITYGGKPAVLNSVHDITERKQAEQALRESEARYRAVVEYSPGAISVSIDDKLVYVNPAAIRLAGVKNAEQLLGRSVFDFIHEDFKAEIIRHRVAMRQTGLPAPPIEIKLRRPDGSIVDTESRAAPVVYNGKPAVLTSSRDITEQKRQAAAIRSMVKATAGSGEQFFSGLVAELARTLGVQYAYVGVRLPGPPVRIRSVALWAHGAPAENCEYDLEGTPCANVVGKHLCHYPADVCSLFPRARLLVEMEAESYLGMPLFSASGVPLGLLTVIDDHPMPHSDLAASLMKIFASRAAAELERLQTEEALRASEFRYRTLFESAQDAILLSTEDGRFIDCNPATLRMFGARRDQIIGVDPILLSPPLQPDGCDSAAKVWEKVRSAFAGVPQFFEWRHSRPDGSEFEAEVSLNRIDAGEQFTLMGIVRDVTDRKRAEVELRCARDELEQRVRERTAELVRANERLRELDRLKSQFLATMSHELRTPLNSIIGFTGTLRQGFPGPVNDEQKKQLDIVTSSARHLLSLINDLLDLSRIEAGKMDLDCHPFNFAEVVAEVVQNLAPMANRKDLHLLTRLSPPAIQMLGDRKRCFQVLLNLVDNAIKFTHRGKVEIDAQADDGQLRVSVADTGIGIKPDQMGQLFEAFRQLDASANRPFDGTGLGLYISQKLLALMHGRITAKSQPGKGSRFTFTLPLRLPGSESADYENSMRR